MRASVCAVLLAAGGSTRMGTNENNEPINKMLLEIGGKTPIRRCAEAFLPHADRFVIAVSEATRAEAERVASALPKPCRVVSGGARRQDSVLNAIAAAEAEVVAIHDCARCLVSSEVIERAVASALECGSGVAAIPVRDTLRRGDSFQTVERGGLYCMQTPQCFNKQMLIAAYADHSEDVTDDAEIWRRAYGSVALTKGDIMNQKLTEAGDIPLFNACAVKKQIDLLPRIGYGEDTHRLVEGRRLILGGVEIPFELGLLGHSDADALTHAVIDAMLGAAALGDIGMHFPDSDPRYKDVCSLELLDKASALLAENGFAVCSVDATVIAQRPKLAPFIYDMRSNLSRHIAGVDISRVSVKATTPEGTGPEGRLESITVRAVASAIRTDH